MHGRWFGAGGGTNRHRHSVEHPMERQQFYDELARRRHRAQIAARHILEGKGPGPGAAFAAVRVSRFDANGLQPQGRGMPVAS